MTRVRICSVPGCDNSKIKAAKSNITTYQIPKDPELNAKWHQAIGLKHIKKFGHVCIKHFTNDNLIRFHSIDGRILLSKPLVRPRLKSGAIPNVFKKGQGRSYSTSSLMQKIDSEDDETSSDDDENEPPLKKFRNAKKMANKKITKACKIMAKKVHTVPETLKSSFEKKQVIKKILKPAQEESIVTTTESGTQCNLFEELWMKRTQNELKSKKCRCVEDFFIYLNPKIPSEEIVIEDPVLRENLKNQSIKVERDVYEHQKTFKQETIIEYDDPLTELTIEKTDLDEHKYEIKSDIEELNNSASFEDDFIEHDPQVSDEEYEEIPIEQPVKKAQLELDYIKHSNNRYECKICKKMCSSKPTITAHCKLHTEKSTLCVKCGKTFARPYALSCHVNKCIGILDEKKKSEALTKAEIDYLNKTILEVDYENLDLNYATRLKLDKNCQVCGKYFPTTRKFFDHLNVHTNRKPYKCIACRTQFSNYSNFLVHVKKFKCPFDSLIIPKYAPQSLATELGYKPQLKPTVRFECRICSYIGSKDIYTNHFYNNKEHFQAEKIWMEKYQLTEFSCRFCKCDPFETFNECITHSRSTHKKFPSNEFIQWYEENQWLMSTTNRGSTDADHCIICKVGLSEDEIGDHLCTEDHLIKEQIWLERSKIEELKCIQCPQIDPFPRLFDLMLHRIEEHITSASQQLTISEFILSIKQPLSVVILPNEEGNIITETGHVIDTQSVGGLEYVKEAGGKFLCRICQQTFSKRIVYFDHQVAVHKKIKPYKCPCGHESGHYERFLVHCSKNNCPMLGRIMPGYAPKTYQLNLSTSTNDDVTLNVTSTNDDGTLNVEKVEADEALELETMEQPDDIEMTEENIIEEIKIKYCCICDSNWEEEHFIDHFNDNYHLEIENQWKLEKNIKKFECKDCGRYGSTNIYPFIIHQKKVHKTVVTEEFITNIKYAYD